MDFSWLIGVVIILVIFGLLLKVLHKLVSAVIITALVLLVATVATGYFIYEDFQDLTINFPSSTNLFLLKNDDGRLVNGMSVSINELKNADLNGIDTVTASTLVEYEAYLEEKEIEEIQDDDDYYKILIYSTELFRETIPETVTPFEEMKLSREEVLDYIESPDGLDAFLNDIADKQINPSMGINKDMVVSALEIELSKIGISDEESFDSILIMACFAEMFGDFSGTNTLAELVKQYKKENLVIYPKTITFKMISYIPIGLIDSLMEKAKDKVKEEVNERNPLR